MEGDALACAATSGGAIERRELFAAVDYGGEVVLDDARFFSGNEAGEDENRLAHADFADGDAFFGAGDAEPVGAGFLQRLGDLRAAVAVAIAFDDGENFSRRLALFVRRVDEVANGVEVVRESGEIDFGPDGAHLQVR